jgi:hypothetical protein
MNGVDKWHLLAHNEWESRHLAAHSELVKKFNDIKVKENMIVGNKSGKTNRRDTLLTQKKNMTLSKIEEAELTLIEKEGVIDSNYSRNLQVIEAKRAKAIREAEDNYQMALKYYENEKEASLAKCKREFDCKKRMLESRGEAYDAEKSFVSKSGAEMALEIQKYKALKDIEVSIKQLSMSRWSVKGAEFPPLPELPEPLPEKPVALQLEEKSQQPKKDGLEWFMSLGEDPALAILREESRAEDRRIRREAEEAETARQERMLAYRRQLEREAEQRRIDRERREKEETPLTQEQEEEEEEEETQEEIDAYIAQRKQEIKKGIKMP